MLLVSPKDVKLFALADTLNELETSGIDIPPSFGAWAFLPQFSSAAYTGFWPTCMYVSGTVSNIAAWCRTRSRFERRVIGNWH